MKVVICTSLPGSDGKDYLLPASYAGAGEHYCGGIRSLYELAFAVAAAGYDAELRGYLDATLFDELAALTKVAPAINLPPRPPTEDDVVIIPEGEARIHLFAHAMLSPARTILLLLGPPGVCGWSFAPGWKAVDMLTVSLDRVGRPEHFKAMTECGFTLWTHNEGTTNIARNAGASCTTIGIGWPGKLPEPPQKTVDVITLKNNRWAPLSNKVLEELDVQHYQIPKVPHADIMEELGKGRIILWPSRIEGSARIQCEARAMGTVPVALDSNPHAVGLDYESGAVTVPTLEAMADAVRRLLKNPEELEELSARAMRAARAQTDWNTYVQKVGQALADLKPQSAGGAARGEMGKALRAEINNSKNRQYAAEDEIARELHTLTVLRSREVGPISIKKLAYYTWRSPVPRTLMQLIHRIFPTLKRRLYVLVGPEKLDNHDYLITTALERVNAVVHTSPDPGRVYNLVLGWYDSNSTGASGVTKRPFETALQLGEMVRNSSARNYWNCLPQLDISSNLLGQKFKEIFGRDLTIDPTIFTGKAVEKLAESTTHDGRVVQCPMDPIPGKIYQVFVDTTEGQFIQWRAVIMAGKPVMIIEQTMSAQSRVQGDILRERLVPLKKILSPAEKTGIISLCREMYLDYGELDIMRDIKGDMWVTDITPTPTFSHAESSDNRERDEIKTAMAKMLGELLQI